MFTWNLMGGSLAIGDQAFELDDDCNPDVDPACEPRGPLGSLDVPVQEDGSFSVPQNAELLPPVEVEVDGDTVTITFELTTPITGNVDPGSGLSTLDANLSIRLQGTVSGVSLGNNCRVGTAGNPVALRFTTGESAAGGNPPVSGEGYDPATSELRLVDARYAVPGASNCGGFLSFIVTPILNGQLNLPSAAGNNFAALDFMVEPTILGPQPPVALPQSVITEENTPVSITLQAEDDADVSFVIIDEPANGTLDTSNLPVVVYSPNPGFSGGDSFSFVADDGTLVSEPALVSITVEAAPVPPVADAQSATTVEGESVSITLTGTDPDDAPLSFLVTELPANGALDTSNLPVVVYTPNPGFTGTDSFAFTVDNGTLTSEPALVSITVEAAPEAPVADAQTVVTGEGQPISITLAGSDADGAPLSFAIAGGPANGSLDTGNLPVVVYTPNPGFSGTDSFSFTVDNGTLVSNPATVTVVVEPAPVPPVANAQSVTTVEGQSVTLTLSGSDSDGAPLSFAIAGGPANGSLDTSNLPVVVYTPNPGFTGTDGFSFTVSNGTLTSEPASVSIVVEEAPVVAIATALNAQPGLLNVSLLGLINIGQLRAQLLDANGTPVQGKELVFSIRGTERCRGTTGADGFASCRPGSGGGALQLLLGSGYTVEFRGDETHLPSSAVGRLLTSLGLL